MKQNINAVWSAAGDGLQAQSSVFHGLAGSEVRIMQDKFETIFDFIDDPETARYSTVVIEDALTKFSSESNYRRALAALFENGDENSSIVVSELLAAPNLVMLFRALRTLGIDQHVDVTTSADRCLIKFRRGRAQLDKRLWNIDHAPYVVREGASAVTTVIDAVKKSAAFSMVRVGHCEIRFLAHNYLFGDSDIKSSAMLQWGQSVDKAKIDWIKGNLATTIANAKMLGFKARDEFSSKPLKILENTVAFCLANLSLLRPGQIQTDPNVHFELGKSEEFLHALSQARKLVLISPRKELHMRVAKAFGGAMDVHHLDLPGEFRIDGPSDLDERFARFIEIEDEVAKLTGKGVVFLVGAGVGGKQYCELARAGGGIGLDLGSTLDAWAGVESRGGGFSVELTGALARFHARSLES